MHQLKIAPLGRLAQRGDNSVSPKRILNVALLGHFKSAAEHSFAAANPHV
jgi:hypothetical protein